MALIPLDKNGIHREQRAHRTPVHDQLHADKGRVIRLASSECFKSTDRFQPLKMGNLRTWVRREYFDDRLRRLLENPDEALERCTRWFKCGPHRSSTVGCIDGFVLKRHNRKKWGNLFKDLFRQSRARRAFRQAFHLELLGIPTARVVAAAERRSWRVLCGSYLVTVEIPGAIDLESYLNTGVLPGHELIQRMATLIARLHKEGFSHRDLKGANILLDAHGQPYLVDLDGLRDLRQVSDARAAADLERLARSVREHPHVTRADYRAFLRAYCRARERRSVPRGQCET